MKQICYQNIPTRYNKTDDCFNLLKVERRIIRKREKVPCYKCIELKLSDKKYNLFSRKLYSIEEIKEGIENNYILKRQEFIDYLKSRSIVLIDKLEISLTNETGYFITTNYREFILEASKRIEILENISDKDTHLVNYTGPVYNTCTPCSFRKVKYIEPEYNHIEGKSNCIKLLINKKAKYFLSRDKVMDLKEIDKFLIENSISTENQLINLLNKEFDIKVFNLKSIDYSWIR